MPLPTDLQFEVFPDKTCQTSMLLLSFKNFNNYIYTDLKRLKCDF
jgi:hypothetical protein